MVRVYASCLFIAVNAIFMSLPLGSPAQAKPCGGSVPCACGDEVVSSRKLATSDPVVNDVCPAHGLIIVSAGVLLDLNANKIRGSGNGVGILVNGVNGVTIKNGKVDHFGTGIGNTGSITSTVIAAVKPMLNTDDGILLQGNNNELTGILAKTNGNNGVTVIGNGNTLQGHNDEYNGFHGIYVQGHDNKLLSNLASENAAEGPGNGITVVGDRNLLDKNKMTKLNIDGIFVQGTDNHLTGNYVTKQKGDGIKVQGSSNVLTNNSSIANRGVGIIVTGTGNPAASTGNEVKKNQQPECSIYGVTTPPTCIQQ